MTRDKYYKIINLFIRIYEGGIDSYIAIDKKNEKHWIQSIKENGEILKELMQILNEEVDKWN